MTPVPVTVLDVVVYQGEVVDEFEGHSCRHGQCRVRANGFAHKKTQGRPHRFSSALLGGLAFSVNPAHVEAKRVVYGQVLAVELKPERGVDTRLETGEQARWFRVRW
jgi:hypothetical protein